MSWEQLDYKEIGKVLNPIVFIIVKYYFDKGSFPIEKATKLGN